MNLFDVSQYEADMMQWYEHMHQYPEVSFEEFKTTEYIYGELEKIGGFTLSRPLATGVIADITCDLPGACIAIRADIDALPTPEETEVPFASKNANTMHACGHDAHSAMLLGVAKYIHDHKHELSGSYRLIFQPAEEKDPGGAKPLVEGGYLDDVCAIIAQHVSPDVPTGQIGISNGPIMAAADVVDITITGKEGHASQPHLNTDVITTGAHIITMLQELVSREIDPLDPAVLSMTMFHAGTAHNVMPRTATLSGTIRTFSTHNREYLAKRIEEVATQISAVHRCSANVVYEYGCAATHNHDELTNLIRRDFQQHFGNDAIITLPPEMGSEDFSAYSARIPAVYYFLGTRNEEKGYVHPLHHSQFRVDPAALCMGAESLLLGAVSLMKQYK